MTAISASKKPREHSRAKAPASSEAALVPSYPITQEYLKEMPELYKDVLTAFPRADQYRAVGDALPYQAIYSVLEGKYSPRAIKLACEQLEQGHAVEIRNNIFIHPTGLGEQLIAAVSGVPMAERTIPAFVPPPPPPSPRMSPTA